VWHKLTDNPAHKAENDEKLASSKEASPKDRPKSSSKDDKGKKDDKETKEGKKT